MEVLVDFGREVYLPWRVTEGEHLGRDYVHPYGPLSVYLNAGLFEVFGVSIRTLVLANLTVLAGVVVLAARLAQRAYGFLTALLTALSIICLFGLGHLTSIGNYNFAAPYSHEATHGMLLLLALLAWLQCDVSSPRRHGIVAGALGGLILLTKSEYVLTLGLVALVVVVRFRVDPTWRPYFRSWLGWTLNAAAAVMLVAIALLIPVMPPRLALVTALNAVLAPFRLASYSSSAHVQHFLGVDTLGQNLWAIARWGGLVAIGAFALAQAVAWLVQRGQRVLALVALSVSIIALIPGLTAQSLNKYGVMLPVLLGVIGWHLFTGWRGRIRDGRTSSPRLWAQTFLWVAAVGMMARMAFAPRIYHYGFFQALIATVCVLGLLLREWPRRLAPHRFSRRALQAGAAMVVLILLGTVTQHSRQYLALKHEPIGTGPDRIYALGWESYPRHVLWERLREYVLASTPANATVLVLPEGVSLNYLTRRRHPLPILDLLPATLPLSPVPLVPRLEAAPPDVVVFVRRDDTAPLGFENYGETPATGKDLVDWVQENYTPLFRAGEFPFSAEGFGLWVYRRNPDVFPR